MYEILFLSNKNHKCPSFSLPWVDVLEFFGAVDLMGFVDDILRSFDVSTFLRGVVVVVIGVVEKSTFCAVINVVFGRVVVAGRVTIINKKDVSVFFK